MPPLSIRGGSLHGIDYALPVASAQVKSAILLAGLQATGPTVVREPGPARDHTERMLKARGASIATEGNGVIRLEPGTELTAVDTLVPGDISSAAFFIVAACLIPDSELLVEDVGINPTRTGIVDVLRDMGGRHRTGQRARDWWGADSRHHRSFVGAAGHRDRCVKQSPG